MVDPLPYMTYQPFLPEVAAGRSSPPRGRRAAPSPEEDERRHREGHEDRPRGEDRDDHPAEGEPWQFDYDVVVVTGGAVSRTFPIPGIARTRSA